MLKKGLKLLVQQNNISIRLKELNKTFKSKIFSFL
jgi:hypothetical protein